MRFALSAFASLAAALFLVGAANAGCWSGRPQTVNIHAYSDDGIFTLEDGRELLLSGLERPSSPAAIAAWRETTALLIAHSVQLYAEKSHTEDRYGRFRAFVVTSDNLLQERLVESGWARVHPIKGSHMCLAALMQAEAHARAAGLGIWSDPAYRLLDAADIKSLLALDGTYQIVSGQVLAVARKRGRLYLNFGRDWQSDFTVTVAPSDARLFESPTFDGGDVPSANIVGKRVRVRGFLGRYNGPDMEIASPDQIEILGDLGTSE